MANFNISSMEKRKLNILFIATEYPSKKAKIKNYGGQASYVKNIGNLLIKKNHKISIYVISNKILKSFENKIEILHFGFSIKLPFLEKISDFVNNILLSLHMNLVIYNENKKKKFDVIQYPSFLNFGIFLFFPSNSKKICRISGITKLWRSYNKQYRNLFHRLSDFIEKKRVQESFKVYAPSRIIAKKASLIYSKKIHTINSPFLELEKKNFTKLNSLKKKEKTILFVGTLNRVKGFDLLADAFFQVFEKYKNVNLIICGRNEKLDKEVNSLNYIFNKCKIYKSRIRYFGILPKKNIFSLYKKIDAVIIPSRLDNFPNVMIEALLFKKPIIGFSNSSLDEIIIDGKNGFLARKKNSKELFDKIDEFLNITIQKKIRLNKNITKLCNKFKKIDYEKKIIDFYNTN